MPGSTFQIKVQGKKSQAEHSAVEAEIIIGGSRKFSGQVSREEGVVQRSITINLHRDPLKSLA